MGLPLLLECRAMADENVFLGGLAAEIFVEQSNACDDLVRNFMVSVVVLAHSFYCV